MKDCLFCKIIRGEEKSWKVMDNDQVYTFLDIYPVSKYHTLVIPKTHYENIYDTPEAELYAMMAMLKKLAALYQQNLGINHVQIINNSGRQAQQEVFHIHFHLIPRAYGDGLNIRWKKHPEWVRDYDRLIAQLF